jgi:hypothetical protein
LLLIEESRSLQVFLPAKGAALLCLKTIQPLNPLQQACPMGVACRQMACCSQLLAAARRRTIAQKVRQSTPAGAAKYTRAAKKLVRQSTPT